VPCYEEPGGLFREFRDESLEFRVERWLRPVMRNLAVRSESLEMRV
jgi:hypothetical protein